MLRPRTLKILAVVLAVYVLLCIPAYLGPAFLQEPSSWFVLVPYFSVHFFQNMGVPGLLEHGGFCGWGWCSPTPLGWAVMALFWLSLAWLLAWAIGHLARALDPSRPGT